MKQFSFAESKPGAISLNQEVKGPSTITAPRFFFVYALSEILMQTIF